MVATVESQDARPSGLDFRRGISAFRTTFAVATLCRCLAACPALAEEPSAADVAAVQACTDLVAANEKNRPPHAPDEFEEQAGPLGRLAAAAKLSAFAGESCIGVLATACLQAVGESARDNQYGDCYDREEEVWDKRLNAAYRAALRHMEKGGRDNLRKTERAWIAWRDASCNQAWATFQGTMAAPIQAYCRMDRTSRQALWMEGWVENPQR
jgi:uncharacterized protein YecT (DUF1311 family)